MKLTHLNHSSVICESDDQLLITDPWMFSNAFHGWYQSPYPHSCTVKKILPSSGKLSLVVLSHAHDDHVDDIFLSQLLRETKVIIPKIRNHSFVNRVLNSGIDEECIIEVDDKGVSIGNYFISSFFDGSLSKEDFIFTISCGDSFFIHANDNWREFSETTKDYIKEKISISRSSNIVLMAQVGLADSYPLFYKGFPSSKKKDIISSKIEYMCESLISNCSKFGIKTGYAYANQSRFTNDFLIDDLDFDPYLLRDQIINKYSKHIKQLYPSDQIINGQHIIADGSQESIIQARLRKFQQLYSKYKDSKTARTLNVEFRLIDDIKKKKDTIFLYAPANIWNDILNGTINLESIITGGMGFIDKPEDYNMKNEYLLLSSWAYINQIKAKKELNLP
ncbi:MBL fold metallo-hydrolase [Prochlorococcus marinus]|uniref:MBL fold metallo-hydrolase n=1 Tax=Prochlorococcus marinus TaxID=1219 RepID=UPI0022B37A38|nr:MBL fold metallo-hydrolase [Prochlorococcus marinus]